MSETPVIVAFVSFPDALYTESLIKNALKKLSPRISIVETIDATNNSTFILQWATYDSILHEITMDRPRDVLSSSYVIRKSLIRKHFLHRAIQTYLTKNPHSELNEMVPATWDLDISHSDELDEMWSDELYDLGQALPDDGTDDEDEKSSKWYILKPGMADRGMGIRLFRSKAGLGRIFDSFEGSDGDSEHEEQEENPTGVITSQLRHFVIQEYLPNPLLIDPREAVDHTSIARESLGGRKFHLRAYCVAQGALKVHLYTRILALFSSTAYAAPSSEEGEEGSPFLSAHLTNTALQETHGEENVRLLQELVGCHILSSPVSNKEHGTLTQDDVDTIVDNVALCIGETFRAGLTSAVHFQTLPNAFELFGADLLVTFDAQTTPAFRVSILELNAEPAIHLTGLRLGWILEELFDEITHACVAPFFSQSFSPKQDDTHAHAHPLAYVHGQAHEEGVRWQRGGSKGHLRTCLDIEVRGASGW